MGFINRHFKPLTANIANEISTYNSYKNKKHICKRLLNVMKKCAQKGRFHASLVVTCTDTELRCIKRLLTRFGFQYEETPKDENSVNMYIHWGKDVDE